MNNVRYVLERPKRASFSPLRLFILRDDGIYHAWMNMDKRPSA